MGIGAVLPSVEGGLGGVEDVITYGRDNDTVEKPKDVFGGRAGMSVLIDSKEQAGDLETKTTPNPVDPLEASGESNVKMTAAKNSRIRESIKGRIITKDKIDLKKDDMEAKLTASGESDVKMTPAKKARIVESMEGKQIATASAVHAVDDNVEAKPSLAVKKHGTT